MDAKGDFVFISKIGKPISYLGIETLFDEEIDVWIIEQLHGLLFYQGVAHELISSGKEVGQKTFGGLNDAILALAYDELFSEYFNAQTKSSYHSFQIIGEVEGLTGIIPDLSVSALHKLGSKHIILLLIEEKSLLDKVNNSSKKIVKLTKRKSNK